MKNVRTKARSAILPARTEKLQREIRRLRTELSVQLKRTARFGHDFNNVLQDIVGEVELYAENAPAGSQVLLRRVMASVASGARLTHELLPAPRTGDPSSPPSPTAISISIPLKEVPRSPAVLDPILIVDDQDALKEFMGGILMKAGYEVVLLSNGAEAVAAVRDKIFSLVLMDIHMPNMNGLVATQKIRKLKGPRSQVPIVAVSGNVPLQHVQSLIDAGMNDHLRKPFKASDLLKKVETWLTHSDTPVVPLSTVPAETIAPAAFERVCALMGRPWALRGLEMLRFQIDELFAAKQRDMPDNTQLANRAHALVSLAALLGFLSLSDRCSELEEECRREGNARSLFNRAKAAALLARKDATALLVN